MQHYRISTEFERTYWRIEQRGFFRYHYLNPVRYIDSTSALKALGDYLNGENAIVHIEGINS